MSGYFMNKGMIDMVMVGCDRVAANGDVANKIGTYLKALAAADNDVPFYVAAPFSTIDWNLNDGKREIPIENRSSDEVLSIRGVDRSGAGITVQLASAREAAANPAFDVTHNRFIKGIITERGVFAPTELAIGTVTAVFGAPVVIAMLLSKRRGE